MGFDAAPETHEGEGAVVPRFERKAPVRLRIQVGIPAAQRAGGIASDEMGSMRGSVKAKPLATEPSAEARSRARYSMASLLGA